MGPGASCTTRVVAGIGVPQVTAVLECAEEAGKSGITVIADGGIKYSGDCVKALAAGASSVMIGNLFAGDRREPGRAHPPGRAGLQGLPGHGIGGGHAPGLRDRYFQEGVEESKFVSEGIEGRVPFKGPCTTWSTSWWAGCGPGWATAG